MQTTISAPYGTDLNTEPITNNACNCKIGADKLAICVLLVLLNKITGYLPLELHISFDKAISEYEKKDDSKLSNSIYLDTFVTVDCYLCKYYH